MTHPILVRLKANTPFWRRTVIILKSTIVIIINDHKHFSHMHYLLKCVRYTEESIYWKLVKHQSNVLNKRIKNKSANQSVEGTGLFYFIIMFFN